MNKPKAPARRMVFVAGQIGWRQDELWETDDFIGQLRQTLQNTVAILAAAVRHRQFIQSMKRRMRLR